MTRTINRKTSRAVSGQEDRSVRIEAKAWQVVLRLRPEGQAGGELGRVELVASISGLGVNDIQLFFSSSLAK
jgi:hypothetical protein